jgi:hypothetical protein
LEIKLIDTNLVEQTIVFTCEVDVFLHVKPGTYTVISQMAQGYAWDCSKSVTVVAGEDSAVTLPYSQNFCKGKLRLLSLLYFFYFIVNYFEVMQEEIRLSAHSAVAWLIRRGINSLK